MFLKKSSKFAFRWLFLKQIWKYFEKSVSKLCCVDWGTGFIHLPSFLRIEDTDDDSKMADLLSYFQQQLTFQESVLKLCQPELESSQTHISGVTSCSL